MKFVIRNFGPIKRFEYDLNKDMIVTYGNNNIGKSYAMQVVYLLLKVFLSNVDRMPGTYGQTYIWTFIEESKQRERIENLIGSFIASENKEKDITQEVAREVNNFMTSVFMPEFINSCKNTFGNLEKALDHNPCILIRHQEYNLEIDLKKSTIVGEFSKKKAYLKRADSDFRKSKNTEEQLEIYVTENIDKPVQILYDEIQNVFIRYMKLILNEFNQVYFLPASRSGIYAGMKAFGSIVAELSKKRNLFNKKIEFPGISEPISDYFIALSNIESTRNEIFKQSCDEIEDRILKGKVTFDRNRNALMYKPNNVEASYEMTEVSSMVSEIAPIVAFLKFIVSAGYNKNGKAILFIEEPEAHLHPNNQIALIEIFSKLVNQNIKLIMSSHSNYVFNKLNNLVLDRKLDYTIYDPIILEETQEGSVSRHLEIDELGAMDENFVDASEALYYEREEIIEKLNMEEGLNDTSNQVM